MWCDFCNFETEKTINEIKMKRILLVIALLCATLGAIACTSAIVSGKLTTNGRPLLWKHRDTGEPNNRVERKVATDSTYEFVAVFDARDMKDSAAWMGFNDRGFAIMNTASYNLNADDVPEEDMDKEGVVMRKALETCVTIDDFELLLQNWPKPMGVEANFGVIDAQGNGAYFETSNYTYKKYDLADEPSGLLVRTNYSYSGRDKDGFGYNREANAKHLLAKHVTARDFAPWVFTEELSRTFYHNLLDEDYTYSGKEWIVDQDFIPRRITSATIVVEGLLPGEDPSLTMMWIGLGYAPCSEIRAVWTGEDGVPVELTGTTPDRHSTLCDAAQARKAEVFELAGQGNGEHYINLRKLYNVEGTGYCQQLIPLNMDTYRQGNAEREKRRQALSAKPKKKQRK